MLTLPFTRKRVLVSYFICLRSIHKIPQVCCPCAIFLGTWFPGLPAELEHRCFTRTLFTVHITIMTQTFHRGSDIDIQWPITEVYLNLTEWLVIFPRGPIHEMQKSSGMVQFRHRGRNLIASVPQFSVTSSHESKGLGRCQNTRQVRTTPNFISPVSIAGNGNPPRTRRGNYSRHLLAVQPRALSRPNLEFSLLSSLSQFIFIRRSPVLIKLNAIVGSHFERAPRKPTSGNPVP